MAPVDAVFAFVLGLLSSRILSRIVRTRSRSSANSKENKTDGNGELRPLRLLPPDMADCGCGASTVNVSAPTLDGEQGFLPFSDYAACCILELQPESIEMCDLYANLKSCAALFLKADRAGMMKQLKEGPVGDVLRRHARMAAVLNALCPSQPPSSATCVLEGRRCPSNMQASYEVCIEGSIQLLVLQLEVLLYRYLAHDWHHEQEIVAINEEDVAVCLAYLRSTTLPSSPSPPPSLHSVDSTSSLDSFSNSRLNGHGPSYRSGSRSPHHRPRWRRNWDRAFRAAVRHNVQRRLSLVRRVRSLHEIFKSLQASNHQQEREARQQPVLLLLGGGMAAGKSTVRELIGRSEFWSRVGKDAVVVEADAIKFQDILYQKLSQRKEFSDDLAMRAEVHEYATKAAEGLLVAAINAQRDIVFDGTHAWLPFIEQTILMARDHQHDYSMGPGLHQLPDGSTVEQYWERLHSSVPRCNGSPNPTCAPTTTKQPYRIELVGVTCDPGLAVVRGIWRQLRIGRSVPVRAQLRSHRLFAEHFEAVAKLVDSATLYHTGGHLSTFSKTWDEVAPKVIAHHSSATQGEMLVNPGAYEQFQAMRHINDEATGVKDLYGDGPPPVTATCPLRTIPELRNPGLQGLLRELQHTYHNELAAQHAPAASLPRDGRSPAPSVQPPRTSPTQSPPGSPRISPALKPLAAQLQRRITFGHLSPRTSGLTPDVPGSPHRSNTCPLDSPTYSPRYAGPSPLSSPSPTRSFSKHNLLGPPSPSTSPPPSPLHHPPARSKSQPVIRFQEPLTSDHYY